jgi:hypothetical protein
MLMIRSLWIICRVLFQSKPTLDNITRRNEVETDHSTIRQVESAEAKPVHERYLSP